MILLADSKPQFDAGCRESGSHIRRSLSAKGIKHSDGRSKTHEIVRLYNDGKGHKTIAKELGISPRIAREILIEQRVWKPGSLRTAKAAAALDKMKPAKSMAIAEEKRRRHSKRTAKTVWKKNDLPLFAWGVCMDKRKKRNHTRSTVPHIKVVSVLRSRLKFAIKSHMGKKQ